MKSNLEFHVITSKNVAYVYLPQHKVFCNIDHAMANDLACYQNTPEKANDSVAKSVEEFENTLANLPYATSVAKEDIEGITIMLATECNLRCTYCHADQGSYSRKRELMDKHTARRAVKAFFNLSPQIRNIRFFGGEPLLNFEVLRDVCQYVSDELGYNNVFYTLETNGTVMDDEILKTIKKYKINVSVSHDGPREVHDCHRRDCNGQGSFALIDDNLKWLQRHNIDFGVQCTFTEKHRCVNRHELTEILTKYTPYYKISPCISKDLKSIQMAEDFIFEPLKLLLTENPIYHTPTLQYIWPILDD